MLVLRAHHLLCIQGYVGNGYDDEFIKNMDRIVYLLNANPYIKIVSKADVICSSCPNNTIRNLCENEHKVKNLDNEVLKILTISIDNIFRYNSLLKILKENLNHENFTRICSSCEWFSYGYCEKGLFRDLQKNN